MTYDIPDQYIDSDIEDINSVNLDISSLVSTFITPIENKRSHAAPHSLLSRTQVIINDPSTDVAKAVANLLKEASFDKTQPQESRAHTFYRMLGLPVMSTDYAFYNPGFNPYKTDKARTANFSISQKINPNIIISQNTREINIKNQNKLFASDTYKSSIYAAVLDIIKPFQNVDENKTFEDLDKQLFTINARKNFLLANYTKTNGADIDFFANHGSHMLRPFLVDPTIADTVMPANRLICEPFLANTSATMLDSNTQLQRPGIEFILRLRLLNNPTNTQDIANQIVFSLQGQNQDISGLSAADTQQLVSALLEDNKVEGSQVSQIFSTPFETLQINKLIKTIKALIYKLVLAGEELEAVRNEVEWTPEPSSAGFEDPDNLFLANDIKTKNKTSQLDLRISDLTILSLYEKNQPELAYPLTDFAISNYQQPAQKDWTKELNNAKEQKNQWVHRGAQALSVVEYITGEISGLGLIDILAIYTAFWAIDLDVLISLLDDEAFARLYQNEAQLRNSNVVNRHEVGQAIYGGDEAISRLEAQIISILSFADKELSRQLHISPTAEGGRPANR